jgi:hypothetical protein
MFIFYYTSTTNIMSKMLLNKATEAAQVSEKIKRGQQNLKFINHTHCVLLL